MMISDSSVRGFVMSYMGSRCAVSSQHKLPGESELLASSAAEFVGVQRVKDAIDQLIAMGQLRRYGPYLSDREIDVL